MLKVVNFLENENFLFQAEGISNAETIKGIIGSIAKKALGTLPSEPGINILAVL